MAGTLQPTIRRLRRKMKRMGDAAAGALAIAALKAIRLVDPDRAANAGACILRAIGPLLRENRIARENLKAACPEKSDTEIDTILRDTWDNLGRIGAEFAHLDRLWDYNAEKRSGRIELADTDIARFNALLNDGKPALIFAAHLANWELPAICARTYGLDSAVLYRRPNVAALKGWVDDTRAPLMGTLIATGLEAPMTISKALERGAHVGMLVDQYYDRGVPVTFFGRETKANPLLARLAQHFDCPIHGTRIVRRPGNRFCAKLTEAITPVRSADGRIDVVGTTQAVMTVVEGWIREHPEQWLWQHRRWRD